MAVPHPDDQNDQRQNPLYRSWTLGNSTEGRKLECRVFAPKAFSKSVSGASDSAKLPPSPDSLPFPVVLFIGGVHGDEVEGVWLCEELLREWEQGFNTTHVGAIVLAQANPDGTAHHKRWNGRHVDLNRNMPTRDWSPVAKNPRYPPGASAASEPETRALVTLIEVCRPRAILSAHSYNIVQVNSNGPARPWAEELSKLCGYPVTEDIGYPTPGSLGTYAGAERSIPTITLEILRGLSREEVLKLHLPVAKRALSYWEENLS